MPANQQAVRLTDHPCILLQQPEEQARETNVSTARLGSQAGNNAMRARDADAVQ
jgi:hypothetical protein